MSLNNIEGIIEKLSRTQIFIIAVLMIIASTVISVYKSNKVIDVTNELMIENKRALNGMLSEVTLMNTNMSIMMNSNLNILSEDVACDYINVNLYNFGYKTIEELMVTLSHNHIYDENRKQVIKDYITKDYINFYVSKRNTLAKVYYNGIPLVVVWNSFNIHEFINKVLDIIFSQKYTMDYGHDKLRKDSYDMIMREMMEKQQKFIDIIHKMKNSDIEKSDYNNETGKSKIQ